MDMFDRGGMERTANAADEKGRQVHRHATLDDFTPANLPNLLSKTDWAVLTAENPNKAKAPKAQNKRAMKRLADELTALGAQFVPAIGKYGNVENSYIVTGITEEQAIELGKRYGQESVLTRRGLVYMDGRPDTPAIGVTVYKTAPDDLYTTIPGTDTFFSVELDFAGDTVAQRLDDEEVTHA